MKKRLKTLQPQESFVVWQESFVVWQESFVVWQLPFLISLKEIVVPQLGIVVPQLGFVVPQLGFVVPQLGFVVPQPGFVVFHQEIDGLQGVFVSLRGEFFFLFRIGDGRVPEAEKIVGKGKKFRCRRVGVFAALKAVRRRGGDFSAALPAPTGG